MIVLSGKISNVQNSSEVSGQTQRGGVGQTRTTQVATFRIDNKPVMLKLKSAPNLGENDAVTVAGNEKGGTFIGHATRNDTTGAIYSQSAIAAYIGGTGMLIFGIPLSFIYIGIPLAVAGLWFIYTGVRISKALNLLKQTPSAA